MAEEIKQEDQTATIDLNPFDEINLSDTAPVIEEKPIVKVEEKPVVIEEKKTEVVIEKKEEKPNVEIKQKEEQLLELDPAVKDKFYKDAYEILSQKKEIEKMNTLDLTKTSDAKKILELSLRFKNSGLDAEEIKDEIEERYAYPKEPKKREDDDPDEFQERLDEWKERVAKIDKKIIRDAKLAKPELAEYNDKLLVPDIPKVKQAQIEQSQEDLAESQKARETYLQKLETGIKDVTGFTANYKDKDVDITASYVITPEEQASLKTALSDIDFQEYFNERWVPKGEYNARQMAEDKYVLENREKIFQKIAHDSASKAIEAYIKGQKNVKLDDNVSRGTYTPDANGTQEQDKMAEHFFSN